MNFDFKNIPPQNTKNLTIGGFSGVDYTNTKHLAHPKRAVDMRNFIHRDGVNRKRPGWEEVLAMNGQINGVWIFNDNKGETHTIIHCGKRIYKVSDITLDYNTYINDENNIKDITSTATYFPNHITKIKYEEIMTDSIIDDRSFGIIRGERVYLFVGIYLVYGKWDNNWELRMVEDNIDTYIPTTTVGISAVGSTINVRSPLDEVNLLSRRRKNKIIGEPPNSDLTEKETDLSESRYNDIFEEPGWGYDYRLALGNGPHPEDGVIFEDLKSVEISFEIEASNSQTPIKWAKVKAVVNTADINNDWTIMNFTDMFEIVGNTLSLPMPSGNPPIIYDIYNLFLKSEFKMSYNRDTYKFNFLFVIATDIDYIDNITNISVKVQHVNNNFVYVLDAPVKENENVSIFLNDKLMPESSYIINYESGLLYLKKSYQTLITGQSNIVMEFTPKLDDYTINASKINKCRFGIIFGHNEVEHLFVSGNPDYPNMDWHTSDRILTSDDELNSYEDLTYFGDLGYAVLGNPTHAIVAYTLLEDSTLAILKEYNPNEASLYLRNSFISNAVDSTGETVVNSNGVPFQKVYYSQFSSTIGEGALNQHSCNNLAGDKLILSNNGIFGLVLNSNIKSNERYTKERSRLINSKLIREKNLKNATSIVHGQKYYLAVNDIIYIADAKFKFQTEGDMQDTFNYEWWVWDNVPVNIWFIHNNELWFGTKEGKVCMLDSNSYEHNDILHSKFKEIVWDDEVGGFYYNKANADIKDGCNLVISGNSYTERLATAWAYDTWGSDTTLTCNEIDFINLIKNNLHEVEFVFGEDRLNAIIEFFETSLERKIRLKMANGEYFNCPIGVEITIIRDYKGENLVETFIDLEGDSYFKILSINYDINSEEKFYKQIYNSSSVFASVITRIPVESFWLTPHFDCGSIEYAKTSNSISMMPEAIDGGEIFLKVFTKDNDYGSLVKTMDVGVNGVETWNTEDFAFTTLSFETSYFSRSYTRKLRIRNFNFIQFYFGSTNSRDCVIHEISLLYVFTKKNRGLK